MFLEYAEGSVKVVVGGGGGGRGGGGGHPQKGNVNFPPNTHIKGPGFPKVRGGLLMLDIILLTG